MKKTIVYKCQTFTEAQDRANLCYIQMNAAKGIKTDHAKREITITNRQSNPIAIYQY